MTFRLGVYTGAVRAHDVIRMLSRYGRTTQLGDATAHYGRVSKTLRILRVAVEPDYRHQIKAQANLEEGRHALARKIFHGRNGQAVPELLRRYRGPGRRARPGPPRDRAVQHSRSMTGVACASGMGMVSGVKPGGPGGPPGYIPASPRPSR
ncbi:Tn3 family transposase [Microtetraspora malaysiensis]|uniref:Tn3 family transposase n=1 Tax=Microtetraspora malaysiensis TaxID=161358 RepID=A0ABW6STX2_9ACTN